MQIRQGYAANCECLGVQVDGSIGAPDLDGLLGRLRRDPIDDRMWSEGLFRSRCDDAVQVLEPRLQRIDLVSRSPRCRAPGAAKADAPPK